LHDISLTHIVWFHFISSICSTSAAAQYLISRRHYVTLLTLIRVMGYSQDVPISCDVSEALSTMKSAVFTMIIW